MAMEKRRGRNHFGIRIICAKVAAKPSEWRIGEFRKRSEGQFHADAA
jgi:hypothetical protein